MKLLVAELRHDPDTGTIAELSFCEPDLWETLQHCADRIEKELQKWKDENP